MYAGGLPPSDVSATGSMVLSFIPPLLLRRHSEFPRALLPTAVFGLAQVKELPIGTRQPPEFAKHRFTAGAIAGPNSNQRWFEPLRRYVLHVSWRLNGIRREHDRRSFIKEPLSLF